jgi:hypothetical protein
VNNQLTTLPLLNDNLRTIGFTNNPIFNIMFDYDILIIKQKSRILYRFKELYYSLKCKKRIVQWMWKSREIRLQQRYHPDHLIQFLEENHIDNEDTEALDEFLSNW